MHVLQVISYPFPEAIGVLFMPDYDYSMIDVRVHVLDDPRTFASQIMSLQLQ